MISIPAQGQILELITDNQVVAAVCLEERKGKLRLLTESGREINAAVKQLLHLRNSYLDLNQTRESLIRTLQICAVRREALVANVDIVGLWEVLKDEEGEFSAIAITELAFGEKADDQVAAVLQALYNERLHFKARGSGEFRPNDATTVDAIITQRTREQEKVTQTQRIKDWLHAVWNHQNSPLPPEGSEIIEMLKDVVLNGEEAKHTERIKEILHTAEISEEEAPFQLLVKLGVWTRDENLMLLRLDIRRELPDAVTAEAQHLAVTTNWLWQNEARNELNTLEVYTVDSAITLDIDDALSITATHAGFEVGIHITDVAAVIAKNSLLDKEASLRATSIYLPDLRIPMLPNVISENLCSLVADNARPALSLFINVDKNGVILNQRFDFTIITTKRLTYKKVDEFLNDDRYFLWQALFKIAQAWRAQRWAQGALFLNFPEINVTFDANGKLHIEHEDSESAARILVSEMMIQVNHLGAVTLMEAGIPCIYRGQAAPRERLFEGSSDDLWLNYRQRMQLSRAEMGTEPIFHNGLGVSAYATLSSPLRRYADLVNQRQLIAFLRGDTPPYTLNELKLIISAIERPISQSLLLEQNRRRYWLLRSLENKRGLETEALVTAIHGQRIQIVLTEFMLDTNISANTYSHLQPGQWLKVKILRTRALADILWIEVIKIAKTFNHKT